jgi:serine/threonine-protein kinase HipA
MRFQDHQMIHVYLKMAEDKVPVGSLALRDRRIYFEYARDFLRAGLQISPLKLPLKSGILSSPDLVFEGLFGVFNDSLPDGWGCLLLDRKLMKTGMNPGDLTPLDRLCYVGHTGMGALIYEPEIGMPDPLPHENFDEIDREIKDFQENDNDQFVDDLLSLNGSSAGARPKILVEHEGADWLIKFRSSMDQLDIGAIEYAYHLMAKDAGLILPEAKLFPSRNGSGFFGVKRFDRRNGKRYHMHTMSGLLHADHRMPSLDYETVMKATLFLTKNVVECEKQFRVAVFNILSCNQDDHAKNFAFLMDEVGEWSVSPTYDIVFSAGPAGEHCTTIMGEGKNPTKDHLLKLASVAQVKKGRALEIIDEVKEAICAWEKFADLAQVNPRSYQLIQRTVSTLIEVAG